MKNYEFNKFKYINSNKFKLLIILLVARQMKNIRLLVSSTNFLLFFSDEVSSLSKILLFYYFEQKATDLQSRLDDLIKLIEKHKDEIWTIENGNNTNVNFEYGPGATVQTILEQRSSTMNTQNKSMFHSSPVGNR